jgi:ABC-type arginine/histidine transport system permease subunit
MSTMVRSLPILLLGTDYSVRLFTTIFVNFVVAIALGLYLGVKRSWLAAVTAAFLAIVAGLNLCALFFR